MNLGAGTTKAFAPAYPAPALVEAIRTSVERYGATTVLGVAGELDIATVPVLDDAVSEALANGSTKNLIVDLLGLTFMDSSGLGALVALKQSQPDLHISLVVGGGIVRKTIDATGLGQWFTIVDSVDQARSAG